MDGEHEPAQSPPAAPAPPAPEPSAAPAPASRAEPAETSPPPSPWRFWLKVAALLFVVGYALAFVVANTRSIPVDFVFANSHVTLIWTILLLLVIGFAGGLLASHLYRHRRSKKPRKP